MTQFNFMEEKELMEKGDKIIEMQKDLEISFLLSSFFLPFSLLTLFLLSSL